MYCPRLFRVLIYPSKHCVTKHIFLYRRVRQNSIYIYTRTHESHNCRSCTVQVFWDVASCPSISTLDKESTTICRHVAHLYVVIHSRRTEISTRIFSNLVRLNLTLPTNVSLNYTHTYNSYRSVNTLALSY